MKFHQNITNSAKNLNVLMLLFCAGFILLASHFTSSAQCITVYPHTQNFDGIGADCSTTCTATCPVPTDWTNATNGVDDDIDWGGRDLTTPTGSTGPSSDHTSGTGRYVYTESSSCYSKIALLSSPCFDFTSITSPYLVFWYHMYGSTMGTLDVEISTDGGSTWPTNVWTLSGNQGNSWKKGTVDLSAYTAQTNFKIRWKGTTGTSTSGDMAIDDVTLQDGPCTTTISTFPHTQNFDGITSDCSTTCTAICSVPSGWENTTDDDIDWGGRDLTTPTGSTGPSADHTSGTGRYVYTESSSCYSKVAHLTSPCFDFTSITSPHLIFWFHMYGSTMGTLDVEISTDGGITWPTNIWTKSGNQGNSWQKAIVDLSAYTTETDFKIRFKATTGTSTSGDMAIDDVTLQDGPCTTSISAFPHTQNFDGIGSDCSTTCTALCPVPSGWDNTTDDDIDWGGRDLTTPTGSTGPSADHTSGTGRYVYTESSSCYSKVAHLTSPCFDFSSLGGPELKFWYHMYGSSMGTLDVEISTNGGITWPTNVWTLSGNQGNSWIEATVNLSAYSGQSDIKLRWKGTTGTSLTSDMAIDDVSIADVASCSATTPGNPTDNGATCGDVTLTRSGPPPAGETWYWQGTSCGTSTVLGSGATYAATASGTYYIRSYHIAEACWSTGCGSVTVTVNPYPANPGNPTSDSPQCSPNNVTITRSGSPPAGVTWYWQGTTCGTSTVLGSGATYTATSNGTYYIRARDNTSLCWSTGCGSITVTINSSPTNPGNPTKDSPTCGNVTLTRSGPPPGGETWYWQGTSCGTSTSLGSGVNYTASSDGTYYIRSQIDATSCWSPGCGSIAVDVTSCGSPFIESIGSASTDRFLDVNTTSDNGFVFIGHTSGWGTYSGDEAYLVKTDAEGTVAWARWIGTNSTDRAYSVNQTSDGGYIFTGYCSGGNHSCGGNGELTLIKTDGSGVYGGTGWAHIYKDGGSGTDGRFVQQTSDGGYMVAGYYSSGPLGSWDGLIMKTTSTGVISWQKGCGGGGDDRFNDAQQTDDDGDGLQDDGYIAAGYSTSNGEGSFDMYLVKFDASGNVSWSNTYGTAGQEKAFAVYQTDDDGDGNKDDGYIIVGVCCGIVTNWYGAYGEMLIIKVSSTGVIEWQRNYEEVSTEFSVYDVEQVADSFVISGTYDAASTEDAFLMSINGVDKSVNWARAYGGTGDDLGYHFKKTGSYVISGEYNGGAGLQIGLAVHTDNGGSVSGGCGDVTTVTGGITVSTPAMVRGTTSSNAAGTLTRTANNNPPEGAAGNPSGSFVCGGPLPIELLSFTGRNEGNVNILEWATATEVNNDYFTIERSKNGKRFEQIGTMNGAGNSSEPLSYSFIDKNPYEGTTYYRLKQTDYDGNYEYFDIIAIEMRTPNAFDITNIFPNPASDDLSFTCTCPSSNYQKLSIQVFNPIGKLVLEKELNSISSGISHKAIPLGGLASGIYSVKFIADDYEKIHKLAIVK